MIYMYMSLVEEVSRDRYRGHIIIVRYRCVSAFHNIHCSNHVVHQWNWCTLLRRRLAMPIFSAFLHSLYVHVHVHVCPLLNSFFHSFFLFPANCMILCRTYTCKSASFTFLFHVKPH